MQLSELLMQIKRKIRIRTRLREYIAKKRRVAAASKPPAPDDVINAKFIGFTESERRIWEAVQIRKTQGWPAARGAWATLWEGRGEIEKISTRKVLEPSTLAVVDFDDVAPSEAVDRPIRWCIYTTLFGAYDTLQPILNPPQGIDCICFSDSDIQVEGWKTVVVPSGDGGVRGAKHYKILPYAHLHGYDASLFVDASTLIHGRIKDFVERWCLNDPFVMWRHSARCDVYDEADAILALQKVEPQGVIDQIIRYEQAGLPKNTGLVEGGFIWRHHGDESVADFMLAWDEETRNGSSRDQLSLGFLMWKRQTRPKTFPRMLGNIRQNCVTSIAAHRALAPLAAPRTITSSSSIRRVCFVFEPEYERAGSTVMRGLQLSQLLRDNISDRFDVSFVSRKEAVADSIVVLTKGSTIRIAPEELEDLKKKNIGVVADFVDGEIRRDLLGSIDVVWAASISALRHALLEPKFPAVDLVTHHVDPRLPDPIGRRIFSAAYVGEPVNAVWSDDISSLVDLLYVNTKTANDDWLQRVGDFPLHYAIRPAPTSKGCIYKPFLKGFTAAHCNANIVVSRDEGDAVSYLGEDYPYLTDGRSVEDALRGLEYARESFGSCEWERGLQVMREVRERSSKKYIVNEVCRSLERF